MAVHKQLILPVVRLGILLAAAALSSNGTYPDISAIP